MRSPRIVGAFGADHERVDTLQLLRVPKRGRVKLVFCAFRVVFWLLTALGRNVAYLRPKASKGHLPGAPARTNGGGQTLFCEGPR